MSSSTTASPNLRLFGPDSPPSDEAVARVLGVATLSPEQRACLEHCACLERCATVAASCNGQLVGVASYELADRDVRVHALAVDTSTGCDADAISSILLEAVELACQAAGRKRVVVSCRVNGAEGALVRRGYHSHAPAAATPRWEKSFT